MTISISGSTEVYGIIGDPVKHSLSPMLHKIISSKINDDIAYVPFLVNKGDIDIALKGAERLNIKGLNVTVPHKVDVIKSIVEIDDNAKIIGAVNTLKLTDRGYKGYNTDILGIEACFSNRNISLEGKIVVIIGAGGASNAAAVMAATKKAREIIVFNRTVEKAESIKKIISNNFLVDIETRELKDLASIDKADIVIQCTSLGMESEVSPVADNTFFDKVSIVLDVIYTPWETRFLKDARAKDTITINGFDMLFYQGVASYEIWRDIKIGNNLKQEIKQEFTDYYKTKFKGL